MGQKGYIPSKRYEDIEEVQTKFLNTNNIVGRSSDIQTESSVYTLECANGSNDTDYIDSDLVLTSVYLNLSGYASSARDPYIEVSINDEIIRKLKLQLSSDQTPQTINETILIPNWLLNAGDKIKLNFPNINDVFANANISFIGYLA
ncbi:unnamed protein product [Rotaria magnacalcarata]